LPSLDLILQGGEWLARGRAGEALRCAEEALRQDPHDADALFLLGAAHYRNGDLAAAEARLKQAIRANAEVAVFHSTLGNVYQDRGALPEAVSAYRRALRLKPGFAEAYNDLGTALFAQGEAARAIESYQRATELRPDHAVAYANLGAVYRKLGMPGEARRALQRELLLRLRSLFRLRRRKRSLSDLAKEQLELGNPGLALRIGRRALEEDANNPALMAALAAALREDGSTEEAIACAKRALELRPALTASAARACRSAHGAGQWRGGKRARATRERATAEGCHPVVEAGRARLEARTRGAGRARLSAGNRIGSQFARRLDPPRQLAAPGRAAGRGESVHRAGGGARRSVCSRALRARAGAARAGRNLRRGGAP
jgi:superkiller protein 3